VLNNFVNGKPLVYLENATRGTINDAGQVILVNSRNVVVSNASISNTTVGIELWNSSNIKIANCTLTNNGEGLSLHLSSRNTIENNLILNNRWYGIFFYESDSNNITGNRVESMISGVEGIFLRNSTNNLFYNNLFNNSNNFYLSNSINTWNTTLSNRTNILGGNAWLSPDGKGFSQTCSDIDSN
ncbi:MAG: right-handed parallel beta-helix repeat-containing protein, partial [Archaeoglobaceae archaeon]|nr:right-handed parallel beta-helix repeat-containing protein [Archaeoglobaceae archaeon]MDW8119021.1 NosD domain-containing protein [Archaeoglobaceae archaeon]